MIRSTLSFCAALALVLSPLAASADAMCGGPKRRPDPTPPPSNSNFAKPPPQGAMSTDDGTVLASRPVEPIEMGMAGGMVLLGGAAGLASRGKKKKGEGR